VLVFISFFAVAFVGSSVLYHTMPSSWFCAITFRLPTPLTRGGGADGISCSLGRTGAWTRTAWFLLCWLLTADSIRDELRHYRCRHGRACAARRLPFWRLEHLSVIVPAFLYIYLYRYTVWRSAVPCWLAVAARAAAGSGSGTGRMFQTTVRIFIPFFVMVLTFIWLVSACYITPSSSAQDAYWTLATCRHARSLFWFPSLVLASG